MPPDRINWEKVEEWWKGNIREDLETLETYFGGGGDKPRLTDNGLCSLSTSTSLIGALSPCDRRLSLKLNDREGSCASAAPTLNWIDFRRGLRARGFSSNEIPPGLWVTDEWAMLALEPGRSSDSKEGFGDGGADIVPGGGGIIGRLLWTSWEPVR